MSTSVIDRVIRRQNWLERVADPLQSLIGATYSRMGSAGKQVKNAMHGTLILGHPLHPALSDVPIGAWTSGLVADFIALRNPALRRAGDTALAVGLASAVPTALTGLTDYHETFAHERRVATVHGLTMATVVGLDAASLGLRVFGSDSHRRLSVALSTAAYAVAILGGYFGGHLVFGIGTMVNRQAFSEGPEDDFVSVGAASQFAEGALRRVDAAGMPALVVRRNGRLHAIAAVCSHAGGPLDEGELHDSQVTCPWHGSIFSVDTGRVLGGPATFSQPSFLVRERDGVVELKLAEPLH